MSTSESGPEALRRFVASLPPRRSPAVTLLTFVGGVLLAQTLTSAITRYFVLKGHDPGLVKALGGVGLEPTVSSFGALTRALASARLELWFAFVTGVVVSVYLITRPLATGYRLSGLVLGRPDGLGVPRKRSDLARDAERIRVSDLERKAFAVLGGAPPREFPIDLAVKALLASAVLFLGLYGLRSSFVSERDHTEFLVLALLGGARLAWLAIASVRRTGGVVWLALPVTLLVIAGLVATPVDQFPDPSLLPVDRALSFDLSTRHDLSGADLRGRDLSHFYLYGKNLDNANLSNANLTGTVMTHARLRGADLSYANLNVTNLSGADLRHARLYGADLGSVDLHDADLRRASLAHADLAGARMQGADLRGASFEDTDLGGVELCGADLRGADFTHATGQPAVDANTRWSLHKPHPTGDPGYFC